MNNATTKEQCIQLLYKLGFAPSSTLGGNLQKEYSGFDCMIWINDERIKLSVYCKYAPFSDHAYIGPPLPAEKELKAFIKFNAG